MNKKEEIANDCAKHLLIQYNNKQNKSLIKDIVLWLLEEYNCELPYWFDLSRASGDHLTELADVIFNVSRFYQGVPFSDDDLKKLCRIQQLKQFTNCFNNDDITKFYKTLFGDNIVIHYAADNSGDLYIYVGQEVLSDRVVKYCIDNHLLAIPICSTVFLTYISQRMLYFPLNDELYTDLLRPLPLVDDVPYPAWNDIEYSYISISYTRPVVKNTL